MRKLLFAIMFVCFGWMPFGAHADKMVNVEYIHKLIEQRWGIVIPYSSKLSTPKVAANMKYLLTLVDMTNKRINGTATTDYGNGEYATMVAADTVAANTAITKLARIKPKFTITTTPNTAEFTFRMSAKGRFMVDWGDNTATEIVRTDTKNTTYTHEYKRAGEYKIKMTGRATEYLIVTTTNYNASSAILFEYAPIAKIEGSLGAIFPTIGDGNEPWQQPRFYATFYRCKDLAGSIPEDLFAGVHGAPIPRMFDATFYECVNLTGSIPEKLFTGIQGAPAERVFYRTFYGCKNLSGGIPEKLFAGIQGVPAPYMFGSTFHDCYGLDGEIPAGLFAGIKGQPALSMFGGTFGACTNLTGSIPENLFAGIQGAPADNMFGNTFGGCKNLTGAIPAKLFGDISGTPASYMFANTFNGCNSLTGEIPAGLFGDLYGAPAANMFNNTFFHCGNLTGEIPAGLFGDISGTPAANMFYHTFYSCFKLTGCVPDGLFGDVGMTLDEIIAEYNTFGNMYGVTKKYCSALAPKFTVTTSADTNEFDFKMSARGLFKIDWGDGTSQIVNRTNTNLTTYSHEYDAPGEYKIGIGGYATGYSTVDTTPAIKFGTGIEDEKNTTVAGIAGSLGAIFGTIDDGGAAGQQPRFYETFCNCANLSGTIPENLFVGIHGAPTTHMFRSLFFKCGKLTGEIPAGMFGDLSGAPANGMFAHTFSGCRNLTGEIPADLFGTISGPAKDNMFGKTFAGCAQLSGQSAKINGVPLYDVWPDATAAQVGGCYGNASGLVDYDEIPDVWKGVQSQD